VAAQLMTEFEIYALRLAAERDLDPDDPIGHLERSERQAIINLARELLAYTGPADENEIV
jgi:hypothetical protein